MELQNFYMCMCVHVHTCTLYMYIDVHVDIHVQFTTVHMHIDVDIHVLYTCTSMHNVDSIVHLLIMILPGDEQSWTNRYIIVKAIFLRFFTSRYWLCSLWVTSRGTYVAS